MDAKAKRVKELIISNVKRKHPFASHEEVSQKAKYIFEKRFNSTKYENWYT